MQFIHRLFLLSGLLFGGALAMAQTNTPSVEEIVHRVNQVAYYQGKDGRAQVNMQIIDSQGRVRERSFTILRRDTANTDDTANAAYMSEQQFYVYFNRPADVNKMVFMVHKKLTAEDDRWLYLPALDLVKRIAASDKRTSFVGSDYFYEDVSGRSIDADTHELINTTSNYYVLRHKPKEAATVEFSYYDMYVHKQSFIPVQIEFYDANREKYRIARALKIENIQGYPTVIEASVESLNTGSKTLMSYSHVGYDIELPESLFTERFLRAAPRQYLR